MWKPFGTMLGPEGRFTLLEDFVMVNPPIWEEASSVEPWLEACTENVAMDGDYLEPRTLDLPTIESGSRVPFRWRLTRIAVACGWWGERTLGLFSLILGLAAVATIPVLQFMSLGYLLEVSRRVARGRLRDGFVGLEKAARVGRFVLGTSLSYLPLLIVGHLSYTAYLVDPHSPAATRGERVTWILGGLITYHVLAAWYAGGRWRHFLWPLLAPWIALRLYLHRPWRTWFPPAMLASALWNRQWWSTSRDASLDLLFGLRLPYLFGFGFRAFLGTLLWLLPPVVLLISAMESTGEGAPLVGALGGVLLIYVVLLLPHLQAHFALHQRFSALFAVRTVRGWFRRAPLAYVIALTSTLLLATPLYLLKIEASPRGLVFVSSLFFVTFALPARLLTGWSVARALRREHAGHPLIRWPARLVAIGVASVYVLFVLLTQYSSWYGTWSLLEQHAVLVPVPFLEIR